jgi:peptide/nickel transport system ATP-binding protein
MYAGKLVEISKAKQVLENPAHPYTQGLKESFPTLHRDTADLHSIEGTPPNLLELPEGCYFRPRCPKATEACMQSPDLIKQGSHEVACFHPNIAEEVVA